MNAAQPTATHVLARALADEQRLAEDFLSLLERERQALIASDLESVSDLAKDKLELAAKLKAQSDRRESLLSVLGDGSGTSDQLLAHPQFSADWAKLRQSLSIASEANRMNGVLIGIRVNAVAHALDVLRGSVDRPSLYSRDGAPALEAARNAPRWAA